MNGEIVEFDNETGYGIIEVYHTKDKTQLVFHKSHCKEQSFEPGELVVFDLDCCGDLYFAKNVFHK